MNYYLKRVIPVLERPSDKSFKGLLNRIKPLIKELPPPGESLLGTLILTDSSEGVQLAEEAKLPCLGLELKGEAVGKERESEGAGNDSAGEKILACPYVVTDISAVTPLCLEQVYRRFYNIPWEILESKRCIVREGTEEDVAQILDVYRDIEKFSMTRPFATIEEGQKYMRDYRKIVYRLYEYGLWVIEGKGSGRIIGVAGLENQIFQEKEYLALGYVIGEKWRGQGYAKEVCRAILDYGREELGMEELHCFVEPENEASRHLVEKLGFCREGSVIQKEGENGGLQKILEHYIWRKQMPG